MPAPSAGTRIGGSTLDVILAAVTRFTGHYYSTEVRSVLVVGVAIRQRYDPAVLRMQRRTCLIGKVIIQSYVWTEREGAERTEDSLPLLFTCLSSSDMLLSFLVGYLLL